MPFQIFICQLQRRQATEDAVDSYLPFETGEGCTDAIVQTVSEGEMFIWLASDIKLFRSFKLFRIAIGCRKTEANELALLDLFVANMDVCQGNSSHLLHRAIVAK